MRASVETTPAFVASAPTLVVDGPFLTNDGSISYDLAPDGRILIIKNVETEKEKVAPSSIVVVQNWVEELKRLVPTK